MLPAPAAARAGRRGLRQGTSTETPRRSPPPHPRWPCQGAALRMLLEPVAPHARRARYSWWSTAGQRAASWSRSPRLHEPPGETPGLPFPPRGPHVPPAATSGATPRRRRFTRSSPRASRTGWCGGKPPSGPCRAMSRRNSAAISSAAFRASDSTVLGAWAAAGGSSSPSPARDGVSARPIMAGTWHRPPPTSPITSSRRHPCGSG